jgi:hypothetical protein
MDLGIANTYSTFHLLCLYVIRKKDFIFGIQLLFNSLDAHAYEKVREYKAKNNIAKEYNSKPQNEKELLRANKEVI